MSRWLDIVAEDLRAFAGTLLEPGLAPARTVRSIDGMSVDADLHATARFLSTHLDDLLEQVRAEEEEDWTSTIYRRTPRRALVPRRSSQFAAAGTTLVPVRFEIATTKDVVNPAALRWLAHIASETEDRLEARLERLERWLSGYEAAASPTVDLSLDVESLMRKSRDIAGEIASVRQRLREELGQLPPSPRLPSPFPRGRAWNTLRHLWNRTLVPSLAGFARKLLSEPIEVADAPFLYQRWCCLKLIRSIEAAGWTSDSDLVGALFLGGAVTFRRGPTKVEVWIEARIGVDRGHPSGARSVARGVRSPDVIFSISGIEGARDLCVLDATLVTEPVRQQEKCEKYMNDLVVDEFHTIAGTPVVARPLRSWLLALDRSPHARVFDPEGRTGILPMSPDALQERPLHAWVNDVLRRAALVSNRSGTSR